MEITKNVQVKVIIYFYYSHSRSLLIRLRLNIRIAFAQPSQQIPYSFGELDVSLTATAPNAIDSSTTRKLRGLYMCGDHVGTATLNGAIESGIRVGESILADSSTGI